MASTTSPTNNPTLDALLKAWNYGSAGKPFDFQAEADRLSRLSRLHGSGEGERYTPQPVPQDIMEARAQGRAEALAILLQQSAEDFEHDYIGSHSIGCTGDYGSHWVEDKLRELFRADDTAWSLMQVAEGEYWHNLGLREEAERLAATPPKAAPAGRNVVPPGWVIEEKGPAGVLWVESPQGLMLGIGYMPPADVAASAILRELLGDLLALSRPRECGSCGEVIRPDAMTGTTCACAGMEADDA